MKAGATMKHTSGAVEYDYVIAGGGTAGCILAARLSEDPAASVLLIEAGYDGRSWKVRMPAAYDYVFKNLQYNWCYEGEPEPTLNGRALYQPRGKLLGGSSAINGLGFIRGHPLDFDRWVAQGADGWSYREVLPYFRRSESWQGGSDIYRGGDGPMKIIAGDCEAPLYRAFLEAGTEAGYRQSDDLNGAVPEGFGAFQANVDRGVRASTAHAYLDRARNRPNLSIVTGALAERINVEGNRARGVAYRKNGEVANVSARRDVIIAGGAFNSPQLLMLSGIGPADELRKLGIPAVADLAGVGQNLQDHPCIYMKYECTEPISVARYLQPHRKIAAGMQWLLFHSGPGTSNNLETVALVRSDASLRQPDIEIQHLPMVFDHDYGVDPSRHGFTYCIGPNRVEGTGWVKLRSADPADPPRIMCNFLSTDRDLEAMRAAVRIGRELANQPAYRPYRGREMEPGDNVNSDRALDDYIRLNAANDFHPTGTCKMGKDRMAVVDPALRVHGIEGLRVVDASVMPSIVGANTNATTVMIGEKAADIIRGLPPLPPADLPLLS
jgi:choline dehydrogenase